MEEEPVPALDVPTTSPAETSPAGATRHLVAHYASYREAQAAVDRLSDAGFDLTRVAIVAEGLTFVERITGRLDWRRALLQGGGSGALIGAVIGFVFGIFNFFAPLTSALSLAFYGLLFGAVIGAAVGVGGYALSRGERDFTSVSGMDAERYSVTIDGEAPEEARRILQGKR